MLHTVRVLAHSCKDIGAHYCGTLNATHMSLSSNKEAGCCNYTFKHGRSNQPTNLCLIFASGPTCYSLSRWGFCTSLSSQILTLMKCASTAICRSVLSSIVDAAEKSSLLSSLNLLTTRLLVCSKGNIGYLNKRSKNKQRHPNRYSRSRKALVVTAFA